MKIRLVVVVCLLSLISQVRSAPGSPGPQSENPASGPQQAAVGNSAWTPHEIQLLQAIEILQQKVAGLEAELHQSRSQNQSPRNAQAGGASYSQMSAAPRIASLASPPTVGSTPLPPPSSQQAAAATAAVSTSPASTHPATSAVQTLLSGSTLNFDFDGYYGYNFNRPLGGVNLLRAYDVLSNNFTLAQTGVMVERLADPSQNRPFGYRLDLMWGEDTETLQGSSVNEPRPQAYRNLYQAYGTYVVPVGTGLTVQFGKWASSLGEEGNYTKDQLNYSRSYYYNFLPFYHMGFLTSYAVNSKLTLQYWLTNGANQTERFNNGLSNALSVILTPGSSTSWRINYFEGNQQRTYVPVLNPEIPSLPTQPGLSLTPVTPVPNGREHIFDSYATWNATKNLLLSGEGDYVINRAYSNSAPAEVVGGVGYAKYQFTPAFDLAGRFEYLDDQGGLFSGKTQDLKEATLTATYQFFDGFQLRGEFRRDFSNQPFFLTNISGVLKGYQNTATLGMIWWFGGKQGAW
jgi:Putative beta-barrel porin-2, OmpL-like. bbp2